MSLPIPSYQYGDKVCVADISALKELRLICQIVPSMYDYAGEEVTISRIKTAGNIDPEYARYYIEEDGGQFFWDERVLFPTNIEPASSDALKDFLLEG